MVLVLKTWTEHPLSVTHGSATVHLLKLRSLIPISMGLEVHLGLSGVEESQHHDGNVDAVIALLLYENGERVFHAFIIKVI